MAERAPNSRVQAILIDMARTWDRLALEAEIGQKSRPRLQLIPGLPTQASRQPSGRQRSDKSRPLCGIGGVKGVP
jgi:hypothetical protein